MKNNRFLLGNIIGFCIAMFSVGCDTTDSDLNQSDLDEIRSEIVALSVSLDCTDASEWAFTEIGSKPCGGPAGYIAYSTQMDTVSFLAKVETYTMAHKKYNLENGIISDCAIDPRPVGVKCEENKAVLIYNRCELIPNPGPCFAAFRKYYFDSEKQECKEFIWGGCDGVVPFETLEECQECE